MIDLSKISNSEIDKMLSHSLDTRLYTTKSLEQLRDEQNKTVEPRFKHTPNTEALKKYWRKVNALNKDTPTTFKSISSDIQRDINRPQSKKQKVNINLIEAKQLFWQIIKTIIAEENKNRPTHRQREYTINKHNKDILHHLVLYLLNDDRSQYALEKGLFMYGLTGRGKSLLFKACKYFTRHLQKLNAPVYPIQIVNAKHIVRQVAEAKTITPINKYLKDCYCFDDVGFEEDYKLFGNGINVMREILTERYEQFLKHGQVTHITSNLLPSQIAERYGERIDSRFAQMFNYVFLDGDTDYRTVK